MNIKEFSRRIGVSAATVSRAFGSSGRISRGTRERIMLEAERFGYRGNYHARNLIRSRVRTVAFFYPEIVRRAPDHFISEIFLGANSAASSAQTPVLVHPLNDDSSELIKDLIFGGAISGVIVVAGSRLANFAVSSAKSSSVPYAVVGRMKGEEARSVLFDPGHGAMLAGRHFSGTGRRSPAYVGGISDRGKREGFLRGLGALSENCAFDFGGTSFEDGASAFLRLKSLGVRPDSVLCANDTIAIGFMNAALSDGISVPRDLAIIGFDDISVSAYTNPPLSTVRLNLREIGRKAFSLLSGRTGEQGEVAGPEKIECELVLRASA